MDCLLFRISCPWFTHHDWSAIKYKKNKIKPNIHRVLALTGPMTPPGNRVQTISPPRNEVDLALLKHGDKLLPMKLVFLNIITSRKGAEVEQTYCVQLDWSLEKVRVSRFIRKD